MNVIKTKNVIRLFIYCIISRRIFYSLWNRKEIDTSTCEMSLYKQEMIMVSASPSFQTDVTMTGTVTLHCLAPLSPFSDFPAHATTNPPVSRSSPCFCRYFHPCHLCCCLFHRSFLLYPRLSFPCRSHRPPPSHLLDR